MTSSSGRQDPFPVNRLPHLTSAGGFRRRSPAYSVFHNSVDVVSGFSRTPPKVRLKADATYNSKSLYLRHDERGTQTT